MNPEGEDFYKASGGTAVADAPTPQAAGGAAKPPTKDSFTWTASEFIEHNRGGSWYLLLALGTAALAAGTYFLTKEYFAVGTIVAVGIIVAIYARQKPKQVTYELSSSGLRIGEKLYSYSLFKSFSLINDGGLNSIQLTPLKKLMPPISAYYKAADEEKISDILGQHLPIEEAKPSGIDRLSRRLRL
ncbi:hypothetical protein HYS85_01920 [Candidatus Saccharibacteria bacterium]|nr:hypothetical protein [Candidatus Saccharibacteria bacterium]